MDVSSRSASESAIRVHPVERGDRLIALDLIRGLAVLGILLANVTGFAHVDLAYYWPPAMPGGSNAADRLIWLAQFVLVDGKFRGLFTILFGAGLVLFTDKFADPRRGIVLQARRLCWLLLFGLAHFYLLFRGDILFSYGCAGFFALFFLKMPAPRLLAIGIIWTLVGAAMQSTAYITPALVEAGSPGAASGGPAIDYYRDYWADRLAEADLQGQLMASAGYWDILRYRVIGESDILYSYFTYCFFETIPMMLVGMGLYHSGIFSGSEQRPAWFGLAIGAVLAGLLASLALGIYVLGKGFPPYLTQLAFFGLSGILNLPVLLGGTCLLALWAARPNEGWLAQRLSLAGRMAFTNYIGTSLVMVLIFQGWAGGLFGQLHRFEMLLVVLLGWALMLAFSRLWLRRYRYGPLEYVWRCLTYWQTFPMRRSATITKS